MTVQNINSNRKTVQSEYRYIFEINNIISTKYDTQILNILHLLAGIIFGVIQSMKRK